MHEPVISDATADRVRHGLGLFADLLGHEARPAALVGGGRVPLHFEGRGLDGVALEVGDLDALGRDRDHLALADREGVARELDESGDVGAEEVLALAQPDDERGVLAGADDEVGLVLVHGEEGERALEAAHDASERRTQVARLLVFAASRIAAASVSVSLAKV